MLWGFSASLVKGMGIPKMPLRGASCSAGDGAFFCATSLNRLSSSSSESDRNLLQAAVDSALLTTFGYHMSLQLTELLTCSERCLRGGLPASLSQRRAAFCCNI